MNDDLQSERLWRRVNKLRLLRAWLILSDPLADLTISEDRLLRVRRRVMAAVKCDSAKSAQAEFFDTKSLSL